MPPSAAQYELFRIDAPILAAALAAAVLVAWGKRRRGNPATPAFSFYCVTTIGFLITNTLEISTTSEAASYWWSCVMYIFIVFVPPIWLAFSLRLTTGRSITPWWAMAVLLAVPVTTLAIIFSGRLVRLMWPSLRLTGGPWRRSSRRPTSRSTRRRPPGGTACAAAGRLDPAARRATNGAPWR